MNHLQFYSHVFFKIIVFEIECVWLISSKIINYQLRFLLDARTFSVTLVP